MVDDNGGSPHVTPGRPKGSGSRAPWVILGLIVVCVMAVIISIGIAILVLRG